jgi:DNA-binding GntR family transcriptional regulator
MAIASDVVGPLELPLSRIDAVLQAIRDGILTRRLLPGQPLIEAELARSLGVSKTPVREALKILSHSGLVSFIPYRGASVTGVNAAFIQSVYDVRLMLEPEAVKRAVLYGDPQHFQSAGAALLQSQSAAAAEDRGLISQLNRQFHSSLYRGCGNQMLIDVLENLRDRSALISVAGWDVEPTWEAEWDEHRALLDAAQRGDSETAARLLRAHLCGFVERTLPHVITETVPAIRTG